MVQLVRLVCYYHQDTTVQPSTLTHQHMLQGIMYLYKITTVRYKILKGENFGEMAHCNNWRIIFWRMPKSSRKSKAS